MTAQIISKELEAVIEKFFLDNGKWELNIIVDTPLVIGGRWLDLGDANYGFRPVDLIEAIKAAKTE